MSKNIDKYSSKIRIGFFFGGRSVEHEVSVISGLQAMYALNTEKYAPVPIYITKEGIMYTGGRVGEIEAYGNIPELLADAERVNLVNEKNHYLLVRYPEKKFSVISLPKSRPRSRLFTEQTWRMVPCRAI